MTLEKHSLQVPDYDFDEVPHFFLLLITLRKLRS
jgi:hypothetical protein